MNFYFFLKSMARRTFLKLIFKKGDAIYENIIPHRRVRVIEIREGLTRTKTKGRS